MLPFLKIQITKEPNKWKAMLIPTFGNKMKEFIYHNKLFIKLEDKTLKSTIVKARKYVNEVQDTILEITFFKTGISTIDEKLNKLELVISAKFNAPILEQINQRDRVIYTLILKETDQEEVILSDEIEPQKDEFIKIDKYNSWNINSTTSAMICGTTGSGKSRIAYYFLKQIRNRTDDDLIYVCDPKKDELQKVARKNFRLKNVYTEKEKMEQAINDFHKLMESRYSLKEKEDYDEEDFQHSFLILDEYSAFRNSFANKKEWEVVDKKIRDIAMKGRAARVHLIIILQHPSADNLSSELRGQLGIRIICGTPQSQEIFKMATGLSVEKEILTKQRGQGYVSLNGNVKDFNAPLIFFPDEIKKN